MKKLFIVTLLLTSGCTFKMSVGPNAEQLAKKEIVQPAKNTNEALADLAAQEIFSPNCVFKDVTFEGKKTIMVLECDSTAKNVRKVIMKKYYGAALKSGSQ